MPGKSYNAEIDTRRLRSPPTRDAEAAKITEALMQISSIALPPAETTVPAAGAILGHFQALKERGVNVAENVARKAGIRIEKLAGIVLKAQQEAGLIDLEGQHTRKVIADLKERLPGITDEEAGMLAVAGEGGLAPMGEDRLIPDEAEARRFLQERIDIAQLEREFGVVIETHGYTGFVELYKTASGDAGYLFQSSGLLALKESFGIDFINSNWKDLVELGKSAGENAYVLFNCVQRALKELIKDRDSLNNIGKDLVELGKAAGRNAYGLLTYYGLPALLEYFGKDKWKKIHAKLLLICRNTSDYNRVPIMKLFSTQYIRTAKQKSIDAFKALDLFIGILEKEPRLSLQILEGVTEAMDKGLITSQLTENEKEIIFSFVDLMHSFSVPLFRLYKDEGREGLVNIFKFALKVLKDEVALNDIDLLKEYLISHGIDETSETIVAAIQVAIPSSGASFVKKKEIMGLFEKYLALGDRRGDIPPSLRDKNFGDSNKTEIFDYRLKEDESFDPERKIADIISALRQKEMPESERKAASEKDKAAFRSALINWFSDINNAQKRKDSLNKFFAWASHNDLLKQKIDAFSADYSGLLMLETLFMDKDNLSVLIREVLDNIPEDNLPIEETMGIIQNSKALLGQLQGIWKSKMADLEKESRIANALRGISTEELKEKIIPNIQDVNLTEKILALAGKGKRVSKANIIAMLLEEPLKSIQIEKEKFDVQKTGEAQLEFRVVKGVPYGLWGLNAGVCIATDIDLWKNPNFMLVAIIDKVTNKVCGFVHIYKTVMDGKEVLTVPGIEPSVEFLSQVKAVDVYPLIEKALINITKAGNFHGLYIPTNPNILSNRKDIAEIVMKKYASKKTTLPQEIHWNNVPSPYLFKDVYEVDISAPALPQAAPEAAQAKPEIPKPGVGTTEGYVNEAILQAYGQLSAGQINAQQAAEMIIQAIITMPDNLEGITNMPTAIGICQQALNETSDPRLTEVLAILQQYDASHEVDERLAEKIRNIWEQAPPNADIAAKPSLIRYTTPVADRDVERRFNEVAQAVRKSMPFIDLGSNIMPGESISIGIETLPQWFRFGDAKILGNYAKAISYATDSPITYYIGLGDSDQPGHRFNVLYPLLATNFSRLIGAEREKLSYNEFKNLFISQMGRFVDAGTRIDFPEDKQRNQRYVARFHFLGKEREVIAYFGFDGTREIPPELNNKYNILISAVGIYDSGFYEKLLSLLDEKAGFMIGEGAEIATSDSVKYDREQYAENNCIFMGMPLGDFPSLLHDFSEVNSQPFFTLGSNVYWSASDIVHGVPQHRPVLLAKNQTVENIISKQGFIKPDSVESRNKLTIEALRSEEDSKSRDPIAVVGIPWWISEELKAKNISPEAYLEALEKEISRQLGKKGVGAADNVHKFKLFLMTKNAAETANNLNNALSGIQTNQEIVVFTPQEVNGMPIQVDNKFINEVFKGHITVIPDAYTDIDISKGKGFPDVDARIAITRLLAWCKDAEARKNDEAQRVSLDAFSRYLGALTGEEIPPVKDLTALLKAIALLKIRPVDYKDITDWRNSYEAVATAL